MSYNYVYMKSDLGIFINVTIGFVKSCSSFSEADKEFMLHNLERIERESEMICEKDYSRKYEEYLDKVGSRAKFFYQTDHSFDCENFFDLGTLFRMLEKIDEEFEEVRSICDMSGEYFIEEENSLYEDERKDVNEE